MATTTLIPVSQYLRMSTDHQRLSLPAQAALIQRYAEAHGFQVVRSYEDAGRSGLTLKRRDGLARLLHDIVKGDPGYKAVLVYDVSRWGRFQDTDEAAHYEFVCKNAGVPVYYCAESFENDCTPPSAIMKTLKRVMAGEYSRELSARMRRTKQINAQAGFWNGGPAPYGFRRMLIDDDGSPKQLLKEGDVKNLANGRVTLVRGSAKEVSRVLQIFRLRVHEGRSTKSIAQAFNRQGMKCRGRVWTYGQIISILTNPTYTGCLTWGRSTGMLGGKRVPVSKERWTLKPGAVQPLIGQETFEAAQKTFANRTIYMSNQELLDRLHSLLRRNGSLSQKMINASRDTPGATTYYHRFGNIRKAYELIGYLSTGNRSALWRMRRQHVRIQSSVLRQILRAFQGQVRVIRQPPGWRKVLTFQDGMKLSVLVCQCNRTSLGGLRWCVPVIPAEKAYPALLCRCNPENNAVRDFYLVPSIDRYCQFRVKEKDEWLGRGRHITRLTKVRKALDSMAKTTRLASLA